MCVLTNNHSLLMLHFKSEDDISKMMHFMKHFPRPYSCEFLAKADKIK